MTIETISFKFDERERSKVVKKQKRLAFENIVYVIPYLSPISINESSNGGDGIVSQ